MTLMIPYFFSFMGEANAGGIGMIFHGGVHQERSYYYLGDNKGLTLNQSKIGANMEEIGDKDDRLKSYPFILESRFSSSRAPFDSGENHVYPAEHGCHHVMMAWSCRFAMGLMG